MPTSVGPNTFGEENLVFGYDLGDISNSYKGEPTTNLAPTSVEKTGGNEYLPYCSLLDIFNTYGPGSGVQFYVSFDAKAKVAGAQYMYTLDGSGRNYAFSGVGFSATTEFRRYELPISNVVLQDANGNGNNLSFYGTYGTGRVLTVKNLQIERKTHATPFVLGTRSATQGLIDLTGDSTIDLTNVSFDSNAQMTFDGSSDRATLGTVPLAAGASTYTIEAVFRADSTKTQVIWEQNHSSVTQHRRACMILLSNGYGGFNGQSNDFHSVLPYSTGTWYHWVVTIDKNAGSNPIKAYSNGVLVSEGDSNAGAANLNIGTHGAAVGYKLNASSEYFDGDIKLVKVYNRVLTASEIKANYNAIKGRFNI